MVNILIVEDELIVAMELSSRLNDLHYNVAGIVSSGEQAIEKSLLLKPDLILMDINIKGKIDGVETAERIKQNQDIPIIFLTAFTDPKTLERAKITEPYGYIVKPFEERELYTIIEISLYKHTMQKKLRDSERRLSTTLKSIGDAVIATNDKAIINYINPAVEKILDTNTDFLGKFILDVFKISDENIYNTAKNAVSEILSSGNFENFPNIITIQNSTGNQVILELNASAIKDDNSSISGIVLIFRDITQKFHTEVALLESEKKYREVVENATDIIFALDLNWRYLYANHALYKISGYSKEECMNLNFLELIDEGYRNKIKYHMMKQFLKKENTSYVEYPFKAKCGKILWFSQTNNIIIEDNKIKGFRLIARDITEKKLIEDKLKDALEKAEESNRLKTVFFNNMSHELRTPMVGILGFAQILKDELLGTSNEEMADMLIKSGHRLLTTLESILEFAQLESNHVNITISEINLSEVVHQLVKQFGERVREKKLRLLYNLKKTETLINSDTNLLRQVLSKIMDNALKFTYSGEIKIDIGRKILDNKNWGFITISDTGIGISKEKLSIIFNEFRQASEGRARSFEGSGLGLSVAKKMISKLNGFITVESEPGIGSSFTVYLPASEEIISQSNKSVSEEIKKELDTNELIPDVLLVEDNKMNKEVAEIYLKKVCNIDYACDANTALKMVSEKNYKIILMDINLGSGMNGVELVQIIRKMHNYKSTPVVALTGYALHGDKEKLLKEGFTHYLAKPFMKNDIVNLVQQITLQKETPSLTTIR